MFKRKIHWVDPHTLFPAHPPYQPLFETGVQGDITEIGMTEYLHIVPSIALYGFKFAVEINKAHEIMNGDFRVFAARELGIKVPVVYVRLPEGRTLLVNIIIRRLRKLFKRNKLFFRRFPVPDFKFDKVPLLFLSQQSLLKDVYPERTDISNEQFTWKKKTIRQKIMTIIHYYLRREVL